MIGGREGGGLARIGEVFVVHETICIELSCASFITADLDCTGAAHQNDCKDFVNLANLNIFMGNACILLK